MEDFNFHHSLFRTFSLVSFIFFIHIFQLLPAEATSGFSLHLISRDSPLSPFYNPSQTPSDRLQNALRRSFSRADRLSLSAVSPDEIQSEVMANSGEYLMNISLGTPPVPILAIADTGSDLTWTQCKPCTGCYEQESPLFDPAASSSYRDVSCESNGCKALSTRICGSDNKCMYSYSYVDESFTSGNIASETVTFASSSSDDMVAINDFVFGCGHNNGGNFSTKASGVIGLGGGSASLISQLNSSIDGQFSYCLVPMSTDSSATSKINFGNKGVVSGSGVVSTPLFRKSPNSFYFLTLEGMSVAGMRLAYKGFLKSEASSNAVEEGNIIIDSGTTLTFLPQDFYRNLRASVIKALGFYPETDPSGTLSICYNHTNASFPIIVAHFTGADLELQTMNAFIRVGNLTCLAIVPTNETAIFGNLAQMNFLVGYDLKNNKVSFKPTDCTKN